MRDYTKDYVVVEIRFGTPTEMHRKLLEFLGDPDELFSGSRRVYMVPKEMVPTLLAYLDDEVAFNIRSVSNFVKHERFDCIEVLRHNVLKIVR